MAGRPSLSCGETKSLPVTETGKRRTSAELPPYLRVIK